MLYEPEYIQRFDVEPQFWQFLRGLRSDDLIVELIQNDLDANASCTSITFNSDELICQGDGEPVSEDGWRRLSFVMGAGVEVESKQFRIGVKNHGLKACFWLGDEIIVQSAGLKMVQTLYKDGFDQRPSPGTLPEPILDGGAAPIGCSIEVPYRKRKLEVTTGEDLTIGIPDPSSLEKIFKNACEHLPGRLLGVVRPGIRDQYTIRLRHHALGSVEIHWRAKRGWKVNTRGRRQFTVFSRECKTISRAPYVPSSAIHERAATFRVPLPARKRQEIPDFFFRDGKSFWAEIAWLTDKRGVPKSSRGVRRYPIGYGVDSDTGRSGVGVHFSGPYISDTERHGMSYMDSLNDHIDDACKDALVDIVSGYLLHQHGARAMELYMANADDEDNDTLNDLVERTIEKRALPLATRVSRTSKRPRRRPLGPKKSSDGTLDRVVLPMFTWDQKRISPLLSEICPKKEYQIDGTVPGPILSCLVNMTDVTITFDEADVIARLQPELESKYFPWEDQLEWQTSLGSASVAKVYLDVLHEAIQEQIVESESQVRENVYLSDARSRATPLIDMFGAVNLPPNFGQREYVALIHPELQRHRLFKRAAWRLKPFRLDDFLDKAQLEKASLVERRPFWTWLRSNWRTVKPRKTLNRIASLPIWPSATGDLLPLQDLCEPRNARVASIVGDAIVRPSRELLRVGVVSTTGRGRLTIRNTPSLQEFEEYLAARIDQFPRGQRLTVDERHAFHKLEKDLATLASAAPRLREYLGDLGDDYSAALDMDGTLRDPGELARGAGRLERLHLLNEHIVDRPNSVLDRIDGWKPRSAPSTEQIVGAFRKDGSRFDAHVLRLQAYVKQSKHEGIDPVGLLDVPCIPVEGELRTPNQIAFRGQRDFWGDWKINVPVAAVNAETQQLYKRIGVVSGAPNTMTSRWFFQWLACQEAQIVGKHTDQVLRHIDHHAGPRAWSTQYPKVPFIMVESDGGGFRLVTVENATNRRGKIAIPDFEALEDAIRLTPAKRPIELVIVESPRVTKPVTARLREFGLRTLSDYAGDPIGVVGTGVTNQLPSGSDFGRILDSLRAGLKGKQIQKRLTKLDLDIDESTLRSNWRTHLLAIRGIGTADSVTAIYRLGRRSFSVTVDGKLDNESGILWIKSDADRRRVLFDVIAEHVFEFPKKYYGSVLDQAYKIEMREYGLLEYSDETQSQDEAEIGDAASQLGGDSGPSATSASHSVPNPNPLRNIPSPGPIPQGNGVANRTRKPRRENTRPQSADENVQKADLKKNQYAWHCQACLAEAEPKMLAPLSSYVEHSENRREIMEAHHCDHVNAGGARHVGNILLLCHYHHGALGDALTRTEITRSLGQAMNRSLAFNSGNGASSPVQGKVVNVQLPQRRTPVSLFFTREHADYWLAKAAEEELL